jgi:hypothetical protein
MISLFLFYSRKIIKYAWLNLFFFSNNSYCAFPIPQSIEEINMSHPLYGATHPLGDGSYTEVFDFVVEFLKKIPKKPLDSIIELKKTEKDNANNPLWKSLTAGMCEGDIAYLLKCLVTGKKGLIFMALYSPQGVGIVSSNYLKKLKTFTNEFHPDIRLGFLEISRKNTFKGKKYTDYQGNIYYEEIRAIVYIPRYNGAALKTYLPSKSSKEILLGYVSFIIEVGNQGKIQQTKAKKD